MIIILTAAAAADSGPLPDLYTQDVDRLGHRLVDYIGPFCPVENYSINFNFNIRQKLACT